MATNSQSDGDASGIYDACRQTEIQSQPCLATLTRFPRMVLAFLAIEFNAD